MAVCSLTKRVGPGPKPNSRRPALTRVVHSQPPLPWQHLVVVSWQRRPAPALSRPMSTFIGTNAITRHRFYHVPSPVSVCGQL